MAILFKKITRPSDLSDKNSPKKTYPQITYQYSSAATLDEIAKEISSNAGVSEGETISVLKDFRTLLKKLLLTRPYSEYQRVGLLLPRRTKQGNRPPGRLHSCRHQRAAYLFSRR